MNRINTGLFISGILSAIYILYIVFQYRNVLTDSTQIFLPA
jgi:cell division protein FtsL